MSRSATLSTKSPFLSVVVCVKDDHDAFRETLTSLLGLESDLWELIVSDSSSDRGLTNAVIVQLGLKSRTHYVWREARGVYPAINEGIQRITGDWVYVLHSGDQLHQESIQPMMIELRKAKTQILLFQTLCMRNNKALFTSHADKDSIFWPHQGVVVRAAVHRELGAYDERYKIVADQLFFHAVRARYEVSFLPLAIAEYDLGGLSSSIDLKVRKEFWLVRKLYGVDPVTNFIWSYVRPITRGLIDRYLSPRLVDIYLKRKYG